MEIVPIIVGLIVLIIQIFVVIAILQLPGLLRTLIREMRQTRAQIHDDVMILTETIAVQSEEEGE